MRKSDLVLEEYLVTQSGYFRRATTVVLGLGITDGNLLFCYGISVGSVEKKISMIEYKNRTVYDCFSNPFTADCGSPALNSPPINIDDRPTKIKDPAIPLSCFQLPYLLPLKTLLVLLPTLLIHHKYLP